MPLTSAQRKEAMPHGAQRRVARRMRRSETWITMVMNGEVEPKTPRGERTLARAQFLLAEAMGVAVEDAFPVEQQQAAAPAA